MSYLWGVNPRNTPYLLKHFGLGGPIISQQKKVLDFFISIFYYYYNE
jgi:hypothetical protein